MTDKNYKYLGRIDTPEKLRRIPHSKLSELMQETRQYLIERVSENGGHLASNLGAVELSVALLRNFSLPHDHIIWDVGHQSYTHKLFTGRFSEFEHLRENGGLSGFTKASESKYDCFGAGHSSTSISAALGFAQADKLAGSDAYTVAVVGDGAFTGGMIHEALNNCAPDLKLIIIINENEMSISRNIGRFAKSLAHIRRTPEYIKTKRATGRAVKKIPLIGDKVYSAMRDGKQAVKNALYGSNLFEDLGLYYLGPADGNDYDAVEALIKEAKSQNESVVIHLKTKKGKGYAPAEEAPGKYHGLNPKGCGTDDCFSNVFGRKICAAAEKDKKICAITAAMCGGTGLTKFKSEYPERFFDVGIAEEHAVTFAAGIAAEGLKPVFAVYSTFLQRSYDQMLHDVAIQKLPVIFCIDRAGLSAHDGITHHGIYDVAIISQMSGYSLFAPVTYRTFEKFFEISLNADSPCALRYPHAAENPAIINEFFTGDEDYSAEVHCDKDFYNAQNDLIIITYGNIAKEAIDAKEKLAENGVKLGIILCERLMPYENVSRVVASIIENSNAPIIFLEEGIRNGGFSMVLADRLSEMGLIDRRYKILAISNGIMTPKLGESILHSAEIDAEAIIAAAKELV